MILSWIDESHKHDFTFTPSPPSCVTKLWQGLSIQEKKRIPSQLVNFERTENPLTQTQLTHWAKESLCFCSLSSQATISHVISAAPHLNSVGHKINQSQRQRCSKAPDLEQALQRWVFDENARTIPFNSTVFRSSPGGY